MSINIATHPLIAHKMTHLRNEKTNTKDFRQLLKELTFYLGFEATRNLTSNPEVVNTPLKMEFQGSKIKDSVAIIPILRAGLGMAEGMLELMPGAAVHHIGMYRAKESLLPIQYYNRLPKGNAVDVAYIVDPCIATANTLHAVIGIIKKWGAKRIVVVAAIGARQGVDRLHELHPDVDMFIGSVDEKLSDDGMILPGIGDAGDRQFGTSNDIPDLMPSAPLSPIGGSKRKASKM